MKCKFYDRMDGMGDSRDSKKRVHVDGTAFTDLRVAVSMERKIRE